MTVEMYVGRYKDRFEKVDNAVVAERYFVGGRRESRRVGKG